jgi:hypothetical protein
VLTLTKDERVVTAEFTKVPLVGKVTVVVLVKVPVKANAPLNVTLPPIVIVLPVFATPVPPRAPVTIVNPAARDPEDNAPTEVIFPCTAEGSVEPIEGTPPADVIKTPEFAVARPAILFAALDQSIWFMVVVAG